MTIPPSYDDDDSTDPLAARLRAALNSEADMVNPSDDGLQQIRSGVESTRRPWWRHPAAPALAAAAVLGLMAGGIAVVFGGDDGKDGNVVAGDTTSASTSASPSPSETASSSDASPSPTTAPAESDVYVYYVMDDNGTPRLYREQRPATGAEPVSAAITAMLGKPQDPDYQTLWPAGTKVLDMSTSGKTATVDLSDFPEPGSADDEAAMQQLVYTVTANDKSLSSVRILRNGTTPSEGNLDWSDPVDRDPMMDIQGLIWLLGPTEGATVSSPVKITGYGTAFEGTVSWEVYRMEKAVATDTKVADGFTQGGANGEFEEFNDSVKLDPGTYEMRAFESSAEDGRPVHVDSKTFTVE